jgi:hypothetical protein
MRRPEELISRAIDLLHKAGFLLEQACATEAVAALNRAVAAARFARAAELQSAAEAARPRRTAASVPQPKRRGR